MNMQIHVIKRDLIPCKIVALMSYNPCLVNNYSMYTIVSHRWNNREGRMSLFGDSYFHRLRFNILPLCSDAVRAWIETQLAIIVDVRFS